MGDWFQRVFKVREGRYGEAKAKLQVRGPDERGRKYMSAKGRDEEYCVGAFSCPTLAQLREQGRAVSLPGKLRVSNVLGDVADKHAEEGSRNATFQVASQFNCLEFTSPTRVPEDGITGYVSDRTQGPACSIACGPATAYRNYFADLEGCAHGGGQTADAMIDNLVDVGKVLGNSRQELWNMRGGYSMADDDQLKKLNVKLQTKEKANQLDEVRAALRIGLHDDVEVTATKWGSKRTEEKQQLVTQVFGSACAVAYNRSRTDLWASFATIVLEGSYEATLWSAVLASERHRDDPRGANVVYLTALGGGVFGNSMDWIEQAMRRSFEIFKDYDLDIRIVTYAGSIPVQLRRLAEDYEPPRK